MKQLRDLWVAFSPLIPLYVGLVAGTVVRNHLLDDEAHPYYYLARYLDIGYASLVGPVTIWWLQDKGIRSFTRAIDERTRRHEDPVIKQRILELKASSSASIVVPTCNIESASCVLGINTTKVSGKIWTAVLLMTFAASITRITIEPDGDAERLVLAKYMSLVYTCGCLLILMCLRGIPAFRLKEMCDQLIRLHAEDPVINKRILELSGSIEPDTELKQD